MDFVRGENFVRIDFPRVQDFSAQRHNGLELAVARLLRGAAGGIAFDEKQLRATEILRRAVGELAGKRGTGREFFSLDLFSLLESHHRLIDGDFRDRSHLRQV